ncbi:Dipeptidyl aminopeptidase/acylaminoacyl peptidase [Pseudidiomarina indica]|uniref:Dipeptidyl aminopeptidase/acylaminoacyl peptidase n=1 Tax=Pseudidiomarina indica TaxID=1159017 RepID=A0A1G6AUX9_9GAMM|nr:S9 family peptidase [Pseudidiomarina indica]SDB12207.1 Dipeptidyl aminopeptidase/acylaminoacyl peptidase [Pseudidiomarina indica]
MNHRYSVAALLALMTITSHASVEPAQIERSLSLRDQWMPLTRDLMQSPTWAASGDQFHYKLSVEGGFMFFRDSVQQAKPTPAFDHQHIATALAQASGTTIDAMHLPFDQFRYTNNDQSIRFYYANQSWQCQLTEVHCEVLTWPNRPRGFSVVRDLRVEAHNPLRPSPDGRYQAHTVGYNVSIQTSNGDTVFATTDGTADNFYDPESIRWAPDSSALVVMKVTPGTARYVDRVLSAPTDQLHPQTITQIYPKPGDAVDIDQPVLIHIERGTAQVVNNELFSQPYQIDRVQWQPDSSSFSFRYVERGHQRVRLIDVNAATATPRTVVDEHSDTFVDMWGGFYQTLQQGDKGAIWLSERDGWAHLYHYNGKGELVNQVTRGDWRVRSVVHVDEQRQQIWFAASGMYEGQDPYYVHYFRVNFDGSELTPLTEGNAHHEAVFSADMNHYIVIRSRVDLPPVAELRRSADASLVRVLANADISRLTAAGFKPPKPFVAKGRDGQTDIWGLIVTPQNFDPKQRYPVIENIYAGPHDSFVPKSFWPFGFHSGGDKVIGMQALADLGFIVVQIDGMGTNNRSKAFHDVAWQNLADSGFPDRILWHQAAAKQFPWYHIADGVGIYGASAGGHSTVAALEFHPEFYRVGVAYAGNYDNRMDKISWNEQWMGYPIGEHYVASSVVEHAHKLTGALLIINGEQDSNVDPASTIQLVDALIKAEKDFDLLVVHGGDHAVGRSTGPIRYIQRRQFDFFLRHLGQKETPRWNQL